MARCFYRTPRELNAGRGTECLECTGRTKNEGAQPLNLAVSTPPNSNEPTPGTGELGTYPTSTLEPFLCPVHYYRNSRLVSRSRESKRYAANNGAGRLSFLWVAGWLSFVAIAHPGCRRHAKV